jgi:hypothetical protein
MSFWQRLSRVLRREKRELDDVLRGAERSANAALDRRERELTASAEDRFAMEQERAAHLDADFDAVRRRIENNDN